MESLHWVREDYIVALELVYVAHELFNEIRLDLVWTIILGIIENIIDRAELHEHFSHQYDKDLHPV